MADWAVGLADKTCNYFSQEDFQKKHQSHQIGCSISNCARCCEQRPGVFEGKPREKLGAGCSARVHSLLVGRPPSPARPLPLCRLLPSPHCPFRTPAARRLNPRGRTGTSSAGPLPSGRRDARRPHSPPGCALPALLTAPLPLPPPPPRPPGFLPPLYTCLAICRRLC